jgi:hypothetical protein
MNTRIVAGVTIALTLAATSAARAELRHVEIRTLGMD